MPRVSNGGTGLYYEANGAGEPLLLLTGIGGTTRSWARQLPAFSRDFRTIVCDPRGSGRSDLPTAPFTTLDMAIDALAVLDDAGVERAHLLGLGSGGMVAQHLAVRWPERVGALVLACSFARVDAHARRLFETWADLLDALGWREVGRLMSLWTFTPRFFEEQPEELQRIEDGRLDRPQPPAAYRAQMEALLAHDTEADLPRITAPTLVLLGEEDIETPLRFARVLADRIPNAELQVLPRTGHRFHTETPDLFNDTVLTFLARHPLGARATPPVATGGLS